MAEELNALFGCKWTRAETTTTACVPTETAQELLGENAVPEIHFGKAHMMNVGPGEALYIPKPISRAEYMRDYAGMMDPTQYGEDPDLEAIDDEEFVEDFKEALEGWGRFQKTLFITPVAVHRGKHGGQLVWVGDRSQEDSRVRGVLAHLCCKL